MAAPTYYWYILASEEEHYDVRHKYIIVADDREKAAKVVRHIDPDNTYGFEPAHLRPMPQHRPLPSEKPRFLSRVILAWLDGQGDLHVEHLGRRAAMNRIYGRRY